MKHALSPSRLAHRSFTDREKIRRFLTGQRFCTVSTVIDGRPYSLPTAFCLIEEQLCIHGSSKSHFLESLAEGKEACITIFAFDGLVLAASAFHHSVNYRSAVIHTRAREIADAGKKLEALRVFTDQMVPGRWDSLRPITEGEIKATRVIAFSIEQASLKMREGPPSFEKEDAGFPVWTGVLPAESRWLAPQPDPKMESDISLPDHVNALYQDSAY